MNMVKLYVQLILNKEINDKTNESWVLKDVPMLWRKKVQNKLEKDLGIKEIK